MSNSFLICKICVCFSDNSNQFSVYGQPLRSSETNKKSVVRLTIILLHRFDSIPANLILEHKIANQQRISIFPFLTDSFPCVLARTNKTLPKCPTHLLSENGRKTNRKAYKFTEGKRSQKLLLDFDLFFKVGNHFFAFLLLPSSFCLFSQYIELYIVFKCMFMLRIV